MRRGSEQGLETIPADTGFARCTKLANCLAKKSKYFCIYYLNTDINILLIDKMLRISRVLEADLLSWQGLMLFWHYGSDSSTFSVT